MVSCSDAAPRKGEYKMGFLSRGPKTDAKSLREFAKQGDVAAIRRAVEADSNVVGRVDSDGMTLLHWVAAIGNTDIAAMLLDAGAAVDAPASNDAWTPLHFAALAGKAKMAAFLVERGASLDARDRGGATPLEIARGENQRQVVEVLQKQKKGAKARKPTADECVQEGKAAGERQDWAADIKSFTQALKIDPGCAQAHCGLALAYAATLDMAKAQEHYAKLEQLDPGFAARFAESPAGMMVVRGGTSLGLDL